MVTLVSYVKRPQHSECLHEADYMGLIREETVGVHNRIGSVPWYQTEVSRGSPALLLVKRFVGRRAKTFCSFLVIGVEEVDLRNGWFIDQFSVGAGRSVRTKEILDLEARLLNVIFLLRSFSTNFRLFRSIFRPGLRLFL